MQRTFSEEILGLPPSIMPEPKPRRVFAESERAEQYEKTMLAGVNEARKEFLNQVLKNPLNFAKTCNSRLQLLKAASQTQVADERDDEGYIVDSYSASNIPPTSYYRYNYPQYNTYRDNYNNHFGNSNQYYENSQANEYTNLADYVTDADWNPEGFKRVRFSE